MFKYLVAICLIVIACGTQSNSNSGTSNSSDVYFAMGRNNWVGTRINIQGVDCIVVAQSSGGSQIGPSISCNWK